MKPIYINYKNFSVLYDPMKFTFRCGYHNWNEEHEQTILEGYALMSDGESIPALPEPKYMMERNLEETLHHFQYWFGENTHYHFDLIFVFRNHEMSIRFYGAIVLKGWIHWGENPADNTFAGLFESSSPVLHSASGPETRAGDDMLFDRQKDRVLRFIPRCKINLGFDWDKQAYRFLFAHQPEVATDLRIQVKEQFIEKKFNIPYSPIKKRNWFSTPPVGWMTWYAVRFDACEAEVLENTRQMKKLLGAYCEHLVSWVDWEWNHSDHSGMNDTCDVFTARPDAYPHGLKFVADKIRELGCIPAIWTGMTNDTRMNRWFQEHRDCVLGPLPYWCGQWWVNPNHPEVYSDYVPQVMKQLKEWGFEGVKWDCLYVALVVWERLFDQLGEASPNFWGYMRRMAEAGRNALGDDVFFLYCNPSTDSTLSSGAGLVNSARIGGDIFKWEEYIQWAIDNLFHRYPLHNVLFYADCDNLVLRSEFNNLNQARSRVSFYGLTGVPLTIGDRFSEYDEERLDMLRRILPVVDMHPVELQSRQTQESIRVFIANFTRPFGSWQTAGIMNTSHEQKKYTLDFAEDCRLPVETGTGYAVYDYWKRCFLGVFEKSVTLSIDPCDTAVLRITPIGDTGLPVLISSTRHITQGGYELTAMDCDYTDRCLRGKVKCIGNEPEILTFLLPEGSSVSAEGGVWEQADRCGMLTLIRLDNGEADWQVALK